MVMHSFYTRNVFSRDNQSLSLPVIHDRAPDPDDAGVHDDIDHRRPGLFAALRQDLLADGRVVAGGHLRDAGKARESMQEIGATDDADELATSHDGKPFDTVLLHEMHHIFESGVLRNGVEILRHDLLHLSATRVDVFVSEPAGTDQKLQPAGALTTSAKLAATEEIAFGDDSHQIAAGLDDREAA